MAEACWATGAEPDAGNPFTGFFDFIEMAYSGEGQDVCSGCLEALQTKHPSQPGDRRRAGHLPVRLRPGRGCGPGLRPGSGRLRGQALLSDGAGSQNQGGPAQAGGAGVGPALRALRAGRPDRRLCPAPGDVGRASRAADRHRVRAALRAIGQRRPRDDLRPAAATGLGPAGRRSPAASWATTPTTPPTSSTSPASATAWRRGRRTVSGRCARRKMRASLVVRLLEVY